MTKNYSCFTTLLLLLGLFIFCTNAEATNNHSTKDRAQATDTLTYYQFKSSVIDHLSKEPLAYASVSVDGSNIATVTNSEGEFLLKIPKSTRKNSITISFIGYKDKLIDLDFFKNEKIKIELEPMIITLHEIKITPESPERIIRTAMHNRVKNYLDVPTEMITFYRETIKKRKTYVSLAEAVLQLSKQPYSSIKEDAIQLYKARKNTDYTKLDTLEFKLQGGPFSAIYLDIMKYPELIFTEDMLGNYEFKLDNMTKINDRLIYVLSFKQHSFTSDPLYFGKLYIDTESYAITSATFNLNIANKVLASEMFIKRKPQSSSVYPTLASYHIDYREKNGKWHLSYARGHIMFKIDWKRRLFNSNYESTIEMAITDWKADTAIDMPLVDKIKPNAILSDQISGFADRSFWGEYNVIEPEKPIGNAIKKIQKKIEQEK